MIDGDKIYLDGVSRDNIDQIRLWRNDPINRRHFRNYRDITSDMQIKWYESMGNNSSDNHIYFQIMQKTHDTQLSSHIVGICGLHYIDWRIGYAEVSIMIGKEFSGKGLATEALNLMCNYGFCELNLHKIWCEIFDNNPASLALFKKVGFVEEGILRDNYFHDGKYGNSHRLSILKSEFAKI